MSDAAPQLADLPTGRALDPGASGGPPPARPGPALAAGAAVAVAVGALRTTGVLEGFPALVVAFLLVLALPSSRLGARRLLIAAGCAAGLLPALWWWDLPLGALGRIGLLLAALAGAVTTVLLWRGPGGLRSQMRLLVPGWRTVDLAIAAAGVLGAVACRGLLTVRGGAESLAALQPAWDNSAHVDMVLMLRRGGAVIGSLGAAASGEGWKFADYPQGYHAIVASLVELLGSPAPGAVADELVLYVRAQGFILATIAVILVAGLCALPRAPRRPATVTLASAGVAGVFLLGPGASAFTSGFPNFVLGCAMGAAALLLAVTMPKVVLPAQLAALGGLLVGVAQSWILLLVLALPAAALVALPPRRAAWRGTRPAYVACAVVVLLTLAGLAQAVFTLRRLEAAEVLVIPGGIAAPDAGLLLAVILAACAVPLMRAPGRTSRAGRVAVVPGAGLLAAATLAAWQVVTSGELSYYFWKLFLGVTLVAAVALAVGVVGRPWSATRPGAVRRSDRWRTAVAVAAGCAGLLQMHGLTGRSTGELLVTPGQLAQAEAVLRAADTAMATGAQDAVVVRADGLAHPVNTQQWLLALTGTWTTQADRWATELLGPAGPADVAHLALDRGATVIVAQEDLPLLDLGGAPADRVATWG